MPCKTGLKLLPDSARTGWKYSPELHPYYLSIEPNHLQSKERENGLKDNKQNFMPVVYFTPMDLIKQGGGPRNMN